MEQQLFTFNDHDDISTLVFNFYCCILKVPIGKYKAGKEFNKITLDYERSLIELYDDTDEPVARFELLLSIGKPLQLDESAVKETEE